MISFVVHSAGEAYSYGGWLHLCIQAQWILGVSGETLHKI